MNQVRTVQLYFESSWVYVSALCVTPHNRCIALLCVCGCVCKTVIVK